MNKFTKVCLIIVAILLGLGLLLGSIGAAMGGRQLFKEAIYAGELSWGNHWFYDGDYPIFDGDYDEDCDEDYEDIEWDFDSEKKVVLNDNYEEKQLAKKGEVTDINAKIGGGELIIKQSDTEYFQIKSSLTGKFQCYVEDETIYIKGLRRNIVNHHLQTVTLFVPQDAMFADVDIHLDAGRVAMQNIVSEQLAIEVGAGQTEIRDCEANTLLLEVGAGEISAKNMRTQDGDFSVGMGRIDFDGAIAGDLKASCSMGSLEMDLEGSEREHNYEVDCALGTIEVGNSYHSGASFDKEIDNQVESTYQLDCSMGNISVEFEN